MHGTDAASPARRAPLIALVALAVITAGCVELTITKEDQPDPVVVNEQLTYWVNVTNNDPGPPQGQFFNDAENVTVTDELPGGVDFVLADPSQGSCSESGGVVTCHLGTLPLGDTASIRIVVTPRVEGIIVNSANVTTTSEEAETGNNQAQEETTVIAGDGPTPQAPENLTCEAEENGNVLTWNASAGATSYNVYRAVDDGPFQQYATTTDTGFNDTAVDAGTTYRYKVTAVGPGGESAASDPCQVTAIPLFPIGVATAVAVVGALGAYVWQRRRRGG